MPAILVKIGSKNKLCVNLIGPVKIYKKSKLILLLKAVKIIDPITGWFVISQYNDKKLMTIANLVITMWLYTYHCRMEIIYYCG